MKKALALHLLVVAGLFAAMGAAPEAEAIQPAPQRSSVISAASAPMAFATPATKAPAQLSVTVKVRSSGKIALTLRSNAKKVQVKYRNQAGNVKRLTKKVKSGKARAVLPPGASDIAARALATTKSAATAWIEVSPRAAAPWIYVSFKDGPAGYFRYRIGDGVLIADFPTMLDTNVGYREPLGAAGCIIMGPRADYPFPYGGWDNWEFDGWWGYKGYLRTVTGAPANNEVWFGTMRTDDERSLPMWGIFNPSDEASANAWLNSAEGLQTADGWTCA